MPNGRRFIAGEHKHIPYNPDTLAEFYIDSESGLPCVRYYAKCDYSQKNLIQAYCKMCSLLQKRAPLNSLFCNYFSDELLIRRGYEITPTKLQLHNYGPNASKNTSDQITFDLQNEMDSYEIAFNLSTDVDFDRLPSNIMHALLQREGRASVALRRLPHHYIKDADDDAAKFQTTATDSDAQRIRHSRAETLTEIENCRSAFLRAFQLQLTHLAFSTNTAPTIAQNLRPEPRLFNEDCNPGSRVYPLPGLRSLAMAISTACYPNVIYAVSKMSSPMLRLEGPKTITQNQSGTCTVRDFYMYKCAYDVLPTAYPFGCIIDLYPRRSDPDNLVTS